MWIEQIRGTKSVSAISMTLRLWVWLSFIPFSPLGR